MKLTQVVRAVVASLMLAAIGPAPIACAEPHNIAIDDPWIAATNPGATVGAGYVTLRNSGVGVDRLLSAQSTRAERVELHEMSMTNGVMRMQPVQAIVIPAGGTVMLQSGGLHIMFLDIDAQYEAGQHIPVTLHFEHAGDVEAQFNVRPRASSGHEH